MWNRSASHQNRSRGATALLALLALTAACSDGTAPPRDSSEWRDLGRLPAAKEAWTIAVLGDRAYVGTSDGVLTRSLSRAEPWRAIGPGGLNVHALRVWQAPEPTLYAFGYPERAGTRPVYRSTDGGETWVPGGDGLRSIRTGAWLGVHHVAIKPSAASHPMPVLYGVVSGTNIARSRDRGATWEMVRGQAEEMATYDCLLHVLGSTLYQGCEAPLDHAWVRAFDIAQDDRPTLGNGTLAIDGIENRRINGFATFVGHATAAQRLYVGVEGGLVSLAPSGQWRWLHKFTQTSPRYTYVRSIWVNPSDERHIVFGGGEEASLSDRAGLWETRDGGETVRPMPNPLGIDFGLAGVPAATVMPDGRGFLMLVDEGERGRRVVLWNGRRGR